MLCLLQKSMPGFAWERLQAVASALGATTSESKLVIQQHDVRMTVPVCGKGPGKAWQGVLVARGAAYKVVSQSTLEHKQSHRLYVMCSVRLQQYVEKASRQSLAVIAWTRSNNVW